MKDLKFPLLLMALLLGFFATYQPMADFAESIPYQLTKRGEILQTVDSGVQKKFDEAIPRGMYENGGDQVISYSSFYEESKRAYFYRIRSHTDREFYARSKIFLILLSQPVVHFYPKATLYVRLNDLGSPFIREEWMYLSDSKYPMYGQAGVTLDFVMPLARSRHPLVWKPRY